MKKKIFFFLTVLLILTIYFNKKILTFFFVKNISYWTEYEAELEVSKFDYLEAKIEKWNPTPSSVKITAGSDFINIQEPCQLPQIQQRQIQSRINQPPVRYCCDSDCE